RVDFEARLVDRQVGNREFRQRLHDDALRQVLAAPLARMWAPETQLACGEARKATTAAISSAWPMRLNGEAASKKARYSGEPSIIPGLVAPGITVLTVMLRAPSSRAQLSVKPSTAR